MTKVVDKIRIGKSVTLKKIYEELEKLLQKTFSSYHLDEDVLNWFIESIVNAEINKFYGETGEYPLVINTKHKDVVSYLKDEGEYLELTLIRALQKIIKKIKNGYFDKKSTYLVIPLSTLDKDGNKCVLRVFRRSDGELCVFVSRVDSRSVWFAFNVFLTSKKSS